MIPIELQQRKDNRMTITILDQNQKLPTPKLDAAGALSVLGLTSWLRCVADQSQRTAASDWTRASALYRERLRAELAERVDWRLVSRAKQARIDRVAAESALADARQAIEDLDL